MTGESETNEGATGTRDSLWSVVGLGAAFTLAALVVAGRRAGVSVAAGAGLGAVNLWALGRIVRGLLEPGGAVGLWTAVGVLKLGLLFGVLYVLIRSAITDILPLALGLGTLPLGIVIAQGFRARRFRSS